MVEIASALQGRDHIEGMIDALSQEFAALPTDALLMYIVDTAPVAALFHLASQYGVLGWAGWRLATTEQQRRDLIKTAVRLQRTKGTPAAIRNAVATLGYSNIDIFTGIGVFYDGEFSYDGEIVYDQGNWASFAVVINVAAGVTISTATLAQITELINEYKNARSRLISLTVLAGE
jgi:phage tail P2-like protein